MERNNTEKEPWPLLKQIPQNELTSLVESYIEYAAKIKYVYYFIGGFMVLILGYNVLFAGRSFPIGEYKTIQATMVGIVGVFLLVFLGYGGYVISKLMKLKKAVNQSAEKQILDKKAVRKEFDTFVKATMGGTGLR